MGLLSRHLTVILLVRPYSTVGTRSARMLVSIHLRPLPSLEVGHDLLPLPNLERKHHLPRRDLVSLKVSGTNQLREYGFEGHWTPVSCFV